VNEPSPHPGSPGGPTPGEHGPHLPAPDELAGSRYSATFGRVVLWLAVARYVIPIAALPLLTRLLRGDVSDGEYLLIVALRPGREVMLGAGAQLLRLGRPNPLLLFLAAFPFFVAAVWVFFLLGRVHQAALRTGEGPAWLARLAPPEKLEVAQRALARRGPVVAFLGRVGGLPPTLLGAAAGVSDVAPVRYLAADAVGAVVVFALTVGVGYGLGETYERAGWVFTVVALVVIFGLATWFSSWLQREFEREGIED
jgi:membrane protein DedA with SNARE-associated domain